MTAQAQTKPVGIVDRVDVELAEIVAVDVAAAAVKTMTDADSDADADVVAVAVDDTGSSETAARQRLVSMDWNQSQTTTNQNQSQNLAASESMHILTLPLPLDSEDEHVCNKQEGTTISIQIEKKSTTIDKEGIKYRMNIQIECIESHVMTRMLTMPSRIGFDKKNIPPQPQP